MIEAEDLISWEEAFVQTHLLGKGVCANGLAADTIVFVVFKS